MKAIIETGAVTVANQENDLTYWAETHFMVVEAITQIRVQDERQWPMSFLDIQNEAGTGGFWELAFSWTEEFNNLHKGREWDGEFYDEIDSFIESKTQ